MAMGNDIIFATDTLTRTTQEAIFGDLTYSPGAQWSFGVGLRWFDIQQRIDGGGNGIDNGGLTVVSDRQSTNVGVTPRFFRVVSHSRRSHGLRERREGISPRRTERARYQQPRVWTIVDPTRPRAHARQLPVWTVYGRTKWVPKMSFPQGAGDTERGVIPFMTGRRFNSRSHPRLLRTELCRQCRRRQGRRRGALRRIPDRAEFPCGCNHRLHRNEGDAIGRLASMPRWAKSYWTPPKSMDSVHGEYRLTLPGDSFAGWRAEYDYQRRESPPVRRATGSSLLKRTQR